MPSGNKQMLEEAAYFIWEREGRPEGRADEHWHQAVRDGAAESESSAGTELLDEEEKAVDGRPDVDFPALLTKDVPGG